MKSITIHNMDDELVHFVEEMAKEWDLSLNKTVKKLLVKVKNINENKQEGIVKKKQHSFSDFKGIWTKEEYEEFEKNTEDFK